METEVCNLQLPAKCTRVQLLHEVPFAVSKECKKCIFKAEAKIEIDDSNSLQFMQQK
ncbi:MAG: hypothetical protein PHE17_17940 [Thiothrix sp.]|uniref:hypothetical protein n=1 Tax=Thiothrix sp. TaxID=1032 RepID=UPI00261B8360|nr:hypothetical protein [Thiothrix sp.]MDD5394902.1 hypothetical protein [Thiothrix sp.]